MAEQSWRWIDAPIAGNPDNVRNILVETTTGSGSKVSRVILECGNIDAEDRDRIAAAKDMEDALKHVEEFLTQTVADGTAYVRLSERLMGIGGGHTHRIVYDALAKARGEGKSDV